MPQFFNRSRRALDIVHNTAEKSSIQIICQRQRWDKVRFRFQQRDQFRILHGINCMKKQWQWSSALPRKLVRRRRLYGFSFIWWSEAKQRLMTGRCTLHRVEMRHSPAANINIIAPILYIIYAHCIAITIRKLCTKQQMRNASGIQSLREKQTFKPSTNLSRNISPDRRKKRAFCLYINTKRRLEVDAWTKQQQQ